MDTGGRRRANRAGVGRIKIGVRGGDAKGTARALIDFLHRHALAEQRRLVHVSEAAVADLLPPRLGKGSEGSSRVLTARSSLLWQPGKCGVRPVGETPTPCAVQGGCRAPRDSLDGLAESRGRVDILPKRDDGVVLAPEALICVGPVGSGQ